MIWEIRLETPLKIVKHICFQFAPKQEPPKTLEDTKQSPKKIVESPSAKVEEKQPEIKPERKLSRNWAALKRSISKVRWFIMI